MPYRFRRSTYVLLTSCVLVPSLSQGCSSDPTTDTPSATDAGTGTDSSTAITDSSTSSSDSSSAVDAAPAAKFTVGGTIVGLEGAGLVLKNGSDTLPISASDASASIPFMFPTPVASGATFEVTATAQPSAPTQTCVVSGGQGTVVGGNVTSVVVNCTSNTYTVGGTITGLTGTGLVLTDNDGPDLVVNASAFAFPAKVESGQPYHVKVKTNPSNPSQTCTVTPPDSGIVGSANVTVAITCTTNTYSVKGVVKNLLGTGLQLTNGAETLPVTAGVAGADVPFTFATKVASGITYTVAVGTDPTSPTQTCTVTGSASAKVTNADVTDVVVTCSCPTGSATFDYTGAVETFDTASLPVCATAVTIDAYGAEGGTSTGEGGGQAFPGGHGARVKSTFTFAAGDKFDLTVGKRGDDSNCGTGGGGGSFAVRAGTVVVAAGGGGGGFSCTVLGNATGGHGLATTNGGDGICTTMPPFGPRDPQTGGAGGNGGSSFYGSGGGGVLTAGVSTVDANAGGAMSPGAGGTPGGGFGSGGGYFPYCCGGSGGGGGYSGGSGGKLDGCAGGGGGSYTSGAAPTLTAGARSGNGQVIVSW